MSLRNLLRRRHQPVASVDPDPLRTPEDATETGLIVGLTGNQRTPWRGIVIKNLKDRRLATGEPTQKSVGPAGKAAGKRSGTPPS